MVAGQFDQPPQGDNQNKSVSAISSADVLKGPNTSGAAEEWDIPSSFPRFEDNFKSWKERMRERLEGLRGDDDDEDGGSGSSGPRPRGDDDDDAGAGSAGSCCKSSRAAASFRRSLRDDGDEDTEQPGGGSPQIYRLQMAFGPFGALANLAGMAKSYSIVLVQANLPAPKVVAANLNLPWQLSIIEMATTSHS